MSWEAIIMVIVCWTVISCTFAFALGAIITGIKRRN